MKTKFINSPALNLLSVIMLCIISFSQLRAQETKVYGTKGIIETGGNISYKYQTTIVQGSEWGNTNLISFLPYCGYFVNDNIEIGVNPLGVTAFWNSSASTTLYQFLLAPSYVFKTENNIYPFIELQLGYSYENVSGSYYLSSLKGLCWGTRAGVKVPFVGHGLLNIGLQYQETTLNQNSDNSRNGTNQLTVSAGYTIWF